MKPIALVRAASGTAPSRGPSGSDPVLGQRNHGDGVRAVRDGDVLGSFRPGACRRQGRPVGSRNRGRLSAHEQRTGPAERAHVVAASGLSRRKSSKKRGGDGDQVTGATIWKAMLREWSGGSRDRRTLCDESLGAIVWKADLPSRRDGRPGHRASARGRRSRSLAGGHGGGRDETTAAVERPGTGPEVAQRHVLAVAVGIFTAGLEREARTGKAGSDRQRSLQAGMKARDAGTVGYPTATER